MVPRSRHRQRRTGESTVKVITEPSVRILSQPMFSAHPAYQVPMHDNEAESLIATAGKVCYDSYGLDGNPVKQHVENLVRSGHHSVVEHVHIGVFVAGISRGCSHEIVRHRMFNYSQRSTRYTAENDAAIVLDPYYAELHARLVDDFGRFRDCGDVDDAELALLKGFLEDCEGSFAEYRRQVELLESLNPQRLSGRDLRKWCRGKARQLLPHALETRMVITGNLRAWRHFFLMRTNRGAEAEIRRLAAAIWPKVERIAPTVFQDLVSNGYDGLVELTEQQ